MGGCRDRSSGGALLEPSGQAVGGGRGRGVCVRAVVFIPSLLSRLFRDPAAQGELGVLAWG